MRCLTTRTTSISHTTPMVGMETSSTARYAIRLTSVYPFSLWWSSWSARPLSSGRIRTQELDVCLRLQREHFSSSKENKSGSGAEVLFQEKMNHAIMHPIHSSSTQMHKRKSIRPWANKPNAELGIRNQTAQLGFRQTIWNERHKENLRLFFATGVFLQVPASDRFPVAALISGNARLDCNI